MAVSLDILETDFPEVGRVTERNIEPIFRQGRLMRGSVAMDLFLEENPSILTQYLEVRRQQARYKPLN